MGMQNWLETSTLSFSSLQWNAPVLPLQFFTVQGGNQQICQLSLLSPFDVALEEDKKMSRIKKKCLLVVSGTKLHVQLYISDQEDRNV